MTMNRIDIEKLKADMAERVGETSARKFSLKVTDNKNPDFYRNFVHNGQDKRLSADVFAGIVVELKADPVRYLNGVSSRTEFPSGPVLTSTFELLLDSLGIDPEKGELAQKLARQFPGALQRVSDLRATLASDGDLSLEEATLDPSEDRPEA